VTNKVKTLDGLLIPVAVRAMAFVSSHLIARIAGSKSTEGMDVRALCLLCAV